ncbi:MAG: lysophospholipid acyltransferase family protein [Spirochaetota bacterium]|nr:lysophospholipid acyltransferase family protein [Spirochaetota bacterium]
MQKKNQLKAQPLTYNGRKEIVYWLTKSTARILLFPFFRLEINGRENLPKRGPFILLPKHQRWEDVPLVGITLPKNVYYVAKHELFSNNLTSWFFESIGAVPLNRQRPLESRPYLRALIELIKKGERIVLFPEGTYYVNEMGPGNIGILRFILSRFDVPFIPIGICYSKVGFRTDVCISIGNPLYGNSSESPETFLEKTMKEIAFLSELI